MGMGLTTKQMLDMATSFYHKSGVEIQARLHRGEKYYLVLLSDNEAITQELDVVPATTAHLFPCNAKFSSVEKAFAVLEAYTVSNK
jgi:uncharacterized protein (DUF952 family)